jgi:7-keto-8-aminopelargonate synthetase-like enzyme
MAASRQREPESLPQVDRTWVSAGGRRLSFFAGCDYYRLGSHPAVARAIGAGLRRFGLSVAASRVTTGNHRLYGQLERRLAGFFQAEAALVLPNGYSTSLAVAQALRGQFTRVLIDEAAHVCLADAAPWFDCPVQAFGHRDAVDLARRVGRTGRSARLLLITDGMFARDGSVAPLREYAAVLPSSAWMLVDDAHGAGVVGAQGRGTLEAAGVGRQRVIQTLTLSKALGVYGGAVLCSRAVRSRLVQQSHLFAGSTPLPLPLVAGALAALALLTAGRRRRLRRNAEQVRGALREAGWAVPPVPGPIIALNPLGRRAAAALRGDLLRAGVYPSLIRYPGGPAEGYFRFVISSEHSPAQLAALIGALRAHMGTLQPAG